MKLAIISVVAVLLPLFVVGGEDPDPESEFVVIEAKKGGWTVEELLRLVGYQTGESIVYDPKNPGIANRKIEFVGDQTVPRKDLFAWFQSLLSFQRLVLVPLTGKKWMVLGMTAPQAHQRPIFVAEEDLGDWADRRGVVLVTTIAFDRPADAALAVELLAPLVTPGGGAMNRVPAGDALVISDFAPKVFALVRLARRLTAERAERNRRLEELLAAARTETAARWFRSKLEAE